MHEKRVKMIIRERKEGSSLLVIFFIKLLSDVRQKEERERDRKDAHHSLVFRPDYVTFALINASELSFLFLVTGKGNRANQREKKSLSSLSLNGRISRASLSLSLFDSATKKERKKEQLITFTEEISLGVLPINYLTRDVHWDRTRPCQMGKKRRQNLLTREKQSALRCRAGERRISLEDSTN